MSRFVQHLFHRPQDKDWLARLVRAAQLTPEEAAGRMLAYPVPRTYWKEAVYSVQKPVLYVVTPRLAGQAGNLAAHDPYAESVIFENAGHALFIDEAERFNRLLADFLSRKLAH